MHLSKLDLLLWILVSNFTHVYVIFEIALDLLLGFCVKDLVDILFLVVLPQTFVRITIAHLFETFSMLLTKIKGTMVVAHIVHDELSFSMELIVQEWARVRESLNFIFIISFTIEFAIFELTLVDFLSTIEGKCAFVHVVIQECSLERMSTFVKELDTLSVLLIVHPASFVGSTVFLVYKASMAISFSFFEFTMINSAFGSVDQMSFSVWLTIFNETKVLVIRRVNNTETLLCALLLIFGPLSEVSDSRSTLGHFNLMGVPVETFTTLFAV